MHWSFAHSEIAVRVWMWKWHIGDGSQETSALRAGSERSCMGNMDIQNAKKRKIELPSMVDPTPGV